MLFLLLMLLMTAFNVNSLCSTLYSYEPKFTKPSFRLSFRPSLSTKEQQQNRMWFETDQVLLYFRARLWVTNAVPDRCLHHVSEPSCVDDERGDTVVSSAVHKTDMGASVEMPSLLIISNLFFLRSKKAWLTHMSAKSIIISTLTIQAITDWDDTPQHLARETSC